MQSWRPFRAATVAACCAVLLGSAAPAASARPRASRDEGSAFTERLGGLLQAAQMNLAQAEAHHEKAVRRARQDAKTLFLREARDFGGEVGRYAVELREAGDELQSAVDSARVAAEASAAKEPGGSWASPAAEAHARLAARAEAAARAARAAERRRERLVKEMEVRAERSLEDIGEQLSRRAGDLTPEVDEAKAKLEAEERDAAQAGAQAGGGAGTPSKGATEAALRSAEARFHEGSAAAARRVGAAVEQSEEDLRAGASGVEGGLEAAEREEIKRVRGAAGRPSKPQRRGRHA
mmetsp:Transcript_69473/g.219494  ORF Transcript_69473/g.219494 Transcript_69473/m.219494 type:complete len:294 (+) Transcript_69473:90-971(+)